MYQLIALVAIVAAFLFGIEHYEAKGRNEANAITAAQKAEAEAKEAKRQLEEQKGVSALSEKFAKEKGEENEKLKLRNAALESKLRSLPPDAQRWLDTQQPSSIVELRLADEADRTRKAGGSLVLGSKTTGPEPSTPARDDRQPIVADREPRPAGLRTPMRDGQSAGKGTDTGAKQTPLSYTDRIRKMREGK